MSDSTDTIVLIHGLWMTPLSWEHWVARYESRGYTVLAPSWPGLEGGVEELRRDPTPLTKLDIGQIVDHYDRIIRGLESKPIIMGHSFGGAFTQVLLDRGLGAAGVGISSGTVKGVPDLPLSTLRVTRHILGNPFNRGKAKDPTEKQFRYSFGNTLTEEESRTAYARYHVASANRVLFQGAAANLSPRTPLEVNFRNNDRAPLLFIASDKDHVVPAKASRSNYEKYAQSSAVTEFKEFPGRSHFLVGQKGWEEIADFALSWATANAMPNGPLRASARPSDVGELVR
jgi:pimeloyl-ACP methyl ester carboxylesterase